MAVNINASLSSGIGITSDNSGVIQFQSNGANTISIQSNGAVLTASGTDIAQTTGRLLRAPQILTSGTSYTTPVGCTAIYVEAVGGGGAGGGSFSTIYIVGSGGGGGGYASKYFTVTGNTAYTYAIGVGGTGVSNAAGNAGGNTTFTVGNTTITASGGGGGGKITASNVVVSGGAGGIAVNGDINITGQDGSAVFYGSSPSLPTAYRTTTNNADFYSGTTGVTGSGYGGSPGGPFFSPSSVGAGIASGNQTLGNAAEGIGCGGGGSRSSANNGTGGAGSNGIIRIWEFT